MPSRLSLFGIFLLLAATPLWAAPQRDLQAETAYEQRLAAIAPAQVEPFRQARVAMDASQFKQSADLLQAVCAAAPSFDVAQRRLGYVLANLGQHGDAVLHAERALALDRNALNLQTLAEVVGLEWPRYQPSPENRDRGLALVQRAAALPGGRDAGGLTLVAQFGLATNHLPVLRSAVADLQQTAPATVPTHYFAAILAAADHEWWHARREIRRAQALGLPKAAADEFIDRAIGWTGLIWIGVYAYLAVLALWVVGLFGLYLFGFALSKITLRHIERGDPLRPVSPSEHRLRRVYRWMLHLAGLYYYLSLPIVSLLVLGVAALLIGLTLVAGYVMIKLTIILLIGAVATIWTLLRSLLIRVKPAEPGRPLARAEAEGLWRVAEEVAAEVKTRPVDEIRITGGTDLAVYERGGWRAKLQNRAHRILILGTAVLPDFREDEFRCVLAHEYGHFNHRDTAGGDIAFRVQNDMMKWYLAMRAAGQARTMNVAFQFLRLYHFLFRRISAGATRLQEVLADRVAAQLYGAPAFERGLRHVIHREISFDRRANAEVKEAIEGSRALRNVYELPPLKPVDEEDALRKALDRATSPDDTHPGPRDRFRYIARLVPPARTPSDRLVWELFRDPAALMAEMVGEIEKRLAPHRKYPAPTASGS